MSLRSVKRNGTARVALVGASTTDGGRVREALASYGVPGGRVDLYGTSSGDVVISEYAGEARLIQAAEPQEIADHDLVFLCERGELAKRVADVAGPQTIMIDLVESLPERTDPLLVHMDINPDVTQGHGGFLALPHPLAILLGEVLHPLHRELGVAEVTAVILRPAADYGEPGVVELREQTVCLLNFGEIPQTTFGSQLAFNILPQRRVACDSPAAEASVERQVSRLLGWAECRISLRLLTAPVFFGHGLQLRVLLDASTTPERIREVFATSGLVQAAAEGPPATPLDVAEQRQLTLAEVSEDGLGGYWLWLVAGATDRRLSEQAIRLARHVGDL